MAVEVKIPELGESITEVVLSKWHASSGDWVEKDEDIFEVESDKITTDVPAPESGVINISVESGEEVDVGGVVATIDPDAERPSGEKKTEAKAEEKDEEEKEEAEAAAQGDQRRAAAAAGNGKVDGVKATSVARKIARERGVDLSSIEGSGTGGRITKSDVLEATEATEEPAEADAEREAPAEEKKDEREKKPAKVREEKAEESVPGWKQAAAPARPADERSERREKMTKLRARIAERLVEAKNSTAMLTTFNECDMTEVVALRRRYKEDFQKKHGVGLGFMSFFVKASCSALDAFPRVNAYIDGDEIVYHDYVDLSIAVSTERGLTVPILRDAHAMSFAEIEGTIGDLARRARDGKLTMDDLTGGTFTITNGGIYGSLNSTPILNPPQSAILGMHAIKNRPVEDPDNPGQVALRPMMNIALSYDHRIIDGAEAVSFLKHIKESIEDPERMLIGV